MSIIHLLKKGSKDTHIVSARRFFLVYNGVVCVSKD